MTENSEPVKVASESDDEIPEVYVSDPEDYLRNRRLKEIHDAKQKVREERQKAAEEPDKESDRAVAGAVATYGAELLPLIEDAQEKGTITENDAEIGLETIQEFIHRQGWLLNPDWIEAKERGEGTIQDDGSIKITIAEGTRLEPGRSKSIPKRTLATVTVSMRVYQDLARLQRKIGGGLSLEENQGPASI